MEPEFWHERWKEGQIGFHEGQVNRHLARWWPTLGVPQDATVLVPLCGKAHDLRWLAEQGHAVLGVELSPVACAAFFEEQGIPAHTEPQGPFTAWRGDRITLLQGDVFDLPATPTAQAAYDRAATVALPPDLRVRYADRLAALLPAGAPLLLVTFDYPQDERQGPPFSVPEGEVARLYEAAFAMERLERTDPEALAAQRDAWGVSRLAVDVWKLVRR